MDSAQETNNVGQKWSSEEESLLLKEIADGIEIADICKNHKRLPGGIKARLKHIACNMHKNGKDIDEIQKTTKLSMEYINKILSIDENKSYISCDNKVTLDILLTHILKLQSDITYIKTKLNEIGLE